MIDQEYAEKLLRNSLQAHETIGALESLTKLSPAMTKEQIIERVKDICQRLSAVLKDK